MIYSYLCEGCGREVTSEVFSSIGSLHSSRCPSCGGLLRRAVCSVGIARTSLEWAFEPHFNNTVGQPVTSLRDFQEKLAAKARENTEATGIEHTYVMSDPRERDAFGITDEAIEMNEEADRKGRLDLEAAVEEALDTGGAGEPPPLVGEKT